MQHLKEFLIRIQTFDLRVIEDDIQLEWGTNEKEHVKTYDLTYETQYYDSFSYRSELRGIKRYGLFRPANLKQRPYLAPTDGII